MPLVIVSYDPTLISRTAVDKILDAIPGIVAKALNVPESGGNLVAEDINVRPRENNPRERNPAQFAVEIFANHYPSRAANLTERASEITDEITNLPAFPSKIKKGFVWVFLGESAFQPI